MVQPCPKQHLGEWLDVVWDERDGARCSSDLSSCTVPQVPMNPLWGLRALLAFCSCDCYRETVSRSLQISSLFGCLRTNICAVELRGTQQLCEGGVGCRWRVLGGPLETFTSRGLEAGTSRRRRIFVSCSDPAISCSLFARSFFSRNGFKPEVGGGSAKQDVLHLEGACGGVGHWKRGGRREG